VFAGVEAGWLAPPQITALPLADAARSHEMLEDRSSVGKLVLTIDG